MGLMGTPFPPLKCAKVFELEALCLDLMVALEPRTPTSCGMCVEYRSRFVK